MTRCSDQYHEALKRDAKVQCTSQSHEAIKSDPSAWDALTLIGVQDIPAFGDEPGYRMTLKNCPNCLSTLAK
jgi:hypothetical protein